MKKNMFIKFLAIIVIVITILSVNSLNVSAEELSSKCNNASSEKYLSEESVFEALAYTFNDESMKKQLNLNAF